MERLSDKAIDIVNDLHRERLDYNSEYLPLINAVQKLSTYEDTDLEPNEITTEPYGCVFYCNRKCNLDGDFCAEGPGCPYEINAETAKHLLDLAQAEKDGRLVVLPCKVGSTAFILDRAEIPQEMRLQAPDIRFVCLDDDNFCRVLCDGKGTKLCAYRIKNDGTDIGKTIFMTRKEAEAALEQRKGEQHDD